MKWRASALHLQVLIALQLCGPCQSLHIPRRDDLLARPPVEPRDVTIPPQGPTRAAFIVFDVPTFEGPVDESTGGSLHPVHPFIEFEKTTSEGALRVELIYERQTDNTVRTVLRGLDQGNHGNVLPLAEGKDGFAHRHMMSPVPVQAWTNDEIMNKMTGAGIALEAWSIDPVLRLGGNGPYNGANSFVERLAKTVYGPAFKFDAESQKLLDAAKRYGAAAGPRQEIPVVQMFYDVHLDHIISSFYLRRYRHAFDISKRNDPRPSYKGFVTIRRYLSPEYPTTAFYGPNELSPQLPSLEGAPSDGNQPDHVPEPIGANVGRVPGDSTSRPKSGSKAPITPPDSPGGSRPSSGGSSSPPSRPESPGGPPSSNDSANTPQSPVSSSTLPPASPQGPPDTSSVPGPGPSQTATGLPAPPPAPARGRATDSQRVGCMDFLTGRRLRCPPSR